MGDVPEPDSHRTSTRGQAPITRTALEVLEARQDTALEVDILILDYLAQKTIDACLAGHLRSSDPIHRRHLEYNVLMMDDFIQLFRQKYSTYRVDNLLRFRLQLLKFTTLFTQRLTANSTTPSRLALKALREQNRSRADAWTSKAEGSATSLYDVHSYMNEPPPSTAYLQRNRARTLRQLHQATSERTPFYGTEDCVSLADILPFFLQLTALVTKIYPSEDGASSATITRSWLELAGEFMLQAVLEQYLVCGTRAYEIIDQIFAWGYVPTSDLAGDDVDGEGAPSAENGADDINPLLKSTMWPNVKKKYISKLFSLQKETGSSSSTCTPKAPPSAQVSSDIVDGLERLSDNYSIFEFETRLSEFLRQLSNLGPPVLVQLESGSLEGMTPDETREFLSGVCGLDDGEQDISWNAFSGLPQLSTR